jgi:alkylhydroperoxidase family enzyme
MAAPRSFRERVDCARARARRATWRSRGSSRFAQQVVAAAEKSDADLDRLRGHGYRDEQIVEVAGLVSLQLLTGTFNLIADIHAPAEALQEFTPSRGDG